VRLKVWDVDERVLKDNDLHSKIVLDRTDAEEYVAQLKRDADRLCSWGIMDYSLLVGVCDREYHFATGVRQKSDQPMETVAAKVVAEASEGGEGAGRDTGRGTGKGVGAARAGRRMSQSTLFESIGSQTPVQLRAACCVGPAHYYIGVIDTLQEWDWRKRGERFFKMWFKRRDGKGAHPVWCHTAHTLTILPAPYCNFACAHHHSCLCSLIRDIVHRARALQKAFSTAHAGHYSAHGRARVHGRKALRFKLPG
jgi:hypothetical protein